MPTNPAVSVIIPLFNKGPYITRALNSVLTQTFQDFEVIVVEDGSTDDGAEIVKRFGDPRIHLNQQEKRVGVSAARNRGIAAAEGHLIVFLDADDEWFSEHLETLMRLRKRYPESGMYATTYFICTTPGDIQRIKVSAIPASPWEGILSSYFLVAARSHDMPILTSSVGIPKGILGEFSGFRSGLNILEDSELWGRIALKYPVAFSWQGGSKYCLESNNRLSNRIIGFEHPFIKIAEDAIRDGQVSEKIVDDLKEYIAMLKIDFAIQNILLGKNQIAREILINCPTKIFKYRKYQFLSISFLPRTVFLFIWKTKRWFNNLIFKTDYDNDPLKILFN
jgi:glycosyltransferase involved in cell wall biosynthesis